MAFAKSQNRCALFDFDLGAGDVATVLDLKPRHTVADLCQNVDTLDQKMFEQSLLEHSSGLSVLAGPENWDALGQVTGECLEKIVKFGRMLFPTVVVDLNTFWSNEFTHLLQQSSTIYLLCRLDLSTIRNARRALDYFSRLRVERDNVHLDRGPQRPRQGNQRQPGGTGARQNVRVLDSGKSGGGESLHQLRSSAGCRVAVVRDDEGDHQHCPGRDQQSGSGRWRKQSQRAHGAARFRKDVRPLRYGRAQDWDCDRTY